MQLSPRLLYDDITVLSDVVNKRIYHPFRLKARGHWHMLYTINTLIYYGVVSHGSTSVHVHGRAPSMNSLLLDVFTLYKYIWKRDGLALIIVGYRLDIEIIKDTPYLALTSELWSLFCGYFVENWFRLTSPCWLILRTLPLCIGSESCVAGWAIKSQT